MNAALKAKWIAALRSGEYQQTRGALRDECGFCCLGVLCEVAALTRAEQGYVTRDGRTTLFAPVALLDQTYQSDLVVLNDPDGAPFEEIADWIERNIPAEGDAA